MNALLLERFQNHLYDVERFLFLLIVIYEMLNFLFVFMLNERLAFELSAFEMSACGCSTCELSVF